MVMGPDWWRRSLCGSSIRLPDCDGRFPRVGNPWWRRRGECSSSGTHLIATHQPRVIWTNRMQFAHAWTSLLCDRQLGRFALHAERRPLMSAHRSSLVVCGRGHEAPLNSRTPRGRIERLWPSSTVVKAVEIARWATVGDVSTLGASRTRSRCSADRAAGVVIGRPGSCSLRAPPLGSSSWASRQSHWSIERELSLAPRPDVQMSRPCQKQPWAEEMSGVRCSDGQHRRARRVTIGRQYDAALRREIQAFGGWPIVDGPLSR
jgi:hypothetical protein